MLHKKINLYYYQVILLFIICPLLSLPCIIYYASHQKKWAYTLLAVFMGLCAMLWPPTGDLYRHNMMYFDFQNMTLINFIDFIKLKLDFLLYTISYIFAKIGIPFEFIRFIFIFISYKLIFNIYEDICKNIEANNQIIKTIFFIFYLSVMFFVIVEGLRFGLAAILLAYGSYQYFAKHNRKGTIYIFLSCITHFSVIPIVLIIILIKIGLKINRALVIILSVACLICCNPTVFQAIIDILPIDSTTHAALTAYITGYWGGDFLEDHSIKYLISKYLGHITIYPLIYLVLSQKNKSKYQQLANILIICTCACFAISDTLYFRIAILFIPIGLSLYFVKSKSYKISTTFILLFCSLISFGSQIYTYRRESTLSREYLLVCPAPIALCNVFTEQWINQHVYEDGAGKSLNY